MLELKNRQFFPTHLSCFDGVAGGLERGTTWWLLAQLPLIQEGAWLAYDLALNTAIAHGGRLGVFCCYDDPKSVEQELSLAVRNPSRVYGSDEDPGRLKKIVSVFDARNVSGDGLTKMIESAAKKHKLSLVVLESFRTIGRQNRAIQWNCISKVEKLSRDLDFCQIVVPIGGTYAILEADDPQKKPQADKEWSALGAIKEKADRWMSMTLLSERKSFHMVRGLRWEGSTFGKPVRSIAQGKMDLTIGGKEQKQAVTLHLEHHSLLIGSTPVPEGAWDETSRLVCTFNCLAQ